LALAFGEAFALPLAFPFAFDFGEPGGLKSCFSVSRGPGRLPGAPGAIKSCFSVSRGPGLVCRVFLCPGAPASYVVFFCVPGPRTRTK
jgi:hypothetical protein